MPSASPEGGFSAMTGRSVLVAACAALGNGLQGWDNAAMAGERMLWLSILELPVRFTICSPSVHLSSSSFFSTDIVGACDSALLFLLDKDPFLECLFRASQVHCSFSLRSSTYLPRLLGFSSLHLFWVRSHPLMAIPARPEGS